MTKSSDSRSEWPSDGFIEKGHIIAQYEIIDFIGSGGMGDLYLANDTSLNRKVALKFHNRKGNNWSDFKRLFIQEAQNAAVLNHPNIVTIYEVGEYQDCPFIAMEYIEGKPLQQSLDKNDLPVKKVLAITKQICEGLKEAHSRQMVHRDIKPGNIFVNKSDQVKILDFGLAQIGGGIKKTDSSEMLGTISYMSPEQVNGDEVDCRSDIFSTGVVLYRLLSGQLPFSADYEAAIFYAIVYQDPPAIAGISDQLQKIVFKALEKNASDRYQSIDEMLSDFNKLDNEQSESSEAVTDTAIPSIAILPFLDLSPGKDQEYFCDGIADEIINALTRIEKLQVASRNAVTRIRNKSINEIGRILKVDTILEGSVRRENNKLRITVQLVSVKNGFYLWSEKYDRDLKDIFNIQDEIARSVAENLKVRMDEKKTRPLIKRFTENLDAYHLYLRGRHYWNKRYEGGLQRSVEYFQEAIDNDPAYALPYTGLADAYNIMGFYNFLPPDVACPRAKAAALKAIEIDAHLSEAYTALGWVNTFYDWNWSEAENNFAHAIELNSKYATAFHYRALYLLARNRMDEALHEVKNAYELDPLSMIIGTSVGAAHYFRREYEEAISTYNKALELDPNFALTHAYMAGPYVCLKKYDKAIVECQKAGSLSGGSTYAAAFLGYSYGKAGERKLAEEILQMLLNLSKKEYVSAKLISIVYIGLDDFDNAFKWLNEACRLRDNWMVWLKVYPVFDDLRPDPRFDELIKMVGLDS